MKKKIKITLILLTFLLFLGYNVQKSYKIEQRKSYIESHDIHKFAHISIDDTINIFDDLKKSHYKSIFENKTLKRLKYMHDKYGAIFTMYVFYEFNGKTIENTPTQYKEEFESNSDWLKFGFHAYSDKSFYGKDKPNISDEYNKFIEEMKEIVGEKSLTGVIRLDRFELSENNLNSINKNDFKIVGLLGADTNNRKDYYLTVQENDFLFKYDYYYDYKNNIFFYNTDIRIENISLFSIKVSPFCVMLVSFCLVIHSPSTPVIPIDNLFTSPYSVLFSNVSL